MKGLLVRLGLPKQEDTRIAAFHGRASGLRYPTEPLACTRAADPMNVLIVLIEEWRFDALDPTTTPNVWRLAQGGQRFHAHFSAGSSSRYGVFGLMYGHPPQLLGRDAGRAAGLAADRGSATPGLPLPTSGAAPASRTPSSTKRSSRPSATRFRCARAENPPTIETGRSPTASPPSRNVCKSPSSASSSTTPPTRPTIPPTSQVPYAPVWKEIDYLELDADFDPRPYRNRHNNAVFYVDRLIGEVLAALEKAGLDDDTIVIVTGDHGEEFNDSGLNYWGHNSNFSRWQTQVPLVVHWPGRPPHEHHGITSHLDVVPTIMGRVLGCSTPVEAYSNGFDLFAPGRPQFVSVGGESGGTGVIEPQRVTLFERYGGVRVMDLDWREQVGEDPSTAHLRSVLESMSVFYAR